MRKLSLIVFLSAGLFLITILSGADSIHFINREDTISQNLEESKKITLAPKIIHALHPDTLVKKEFAKEQTGIKTNTILDSVPFISQLPDLERGCEVTSLAMLLQFEGISIDKLELAMKIKKVPFRNNNYVRGNPNDGFVGDIYTFKKSGYGVYHEPIAKLAENYLPGKVKDLTGQAIDQIYQFIDNGKPVWIITNSTFSLLPEAQFTIWKTNSGQVKITYREHSVVIVGYDHDFVYVNDPLDTKGYKALPRSPFEKAWIQMGSQAIGIQG